jgi:RND family efflux transporter MFP subunit
MGTGASFPTPGTRVEAGELLATIAPTPGAPEDAARATLAVVEAQARIEASRVEVERVERMVADQAIPGRRLDEAQRQLQVAEAGLAAARRAQGVYASAQSGRGSGSWRITSPIAGIIDAVDVSPGEAVGPEDLLFRVVDPDVLWLRADVPEAWASRFARDANASFQLIGDERWHAIDLAGAEGSSASLVHASRSVDAGSRTVRVVYALGEVGEALRVGAAVRVSIPVGDLVDAVTVPRSALLDVEGRSVVYVQVEGESFAERSVRTGPSEGDRVAILAGVEGGERVVTRGAHLIRLAGSSGVVGHGHVH